MARRRGGFAPRIRGPRRMTEWGASADTDVAQVLAAGTSVIDQVFTEAILEDVAPGTFVRVRGELWVASDQASASEEPFGAMGFALVSEPALVAGVASVPTPITDETSELWFVWQPFQAYFATGQGVVWTRYSFDSKAMRKFEEGQGLVVVLENAHATFGMEYIIKYRILAKLH